GFNIAYAVSPGSFADFITYIVPELRSRGRLDRSYRPGTLREKLSDNGTARLAADHPAARYRTELPIAAQQ
ncbi:5,10-methylene tetrahydromethanopterin reductase, partial [Streptomyces sp. DSM 41981]|nr:5,10-methylene tetrahydromethanopterin reductase [Streptomyces sp. DSM 41981]